MNTQPIDRYAQEPPHEWVGRLWASTCRDANGQYLWGQILDVAPGRIKVRWLGRREWDDEWVTRDSGTLSRASERAPTDGAH